MQSIFQFVISALVGDATAALVSPILQLAPRYTLSCALHQAETSLRIIIAAILETAFPNA